MRQEHLIVVLLRVVLIADVASLLLFVAVYTKLAPWWRSQVGRTLVIKDLLLALALTPSVLSLFFMFSRLTSLIAAWADVGLLGAVAPVMAWRTVVWSRMRHDGHRPR